MESQIKALTQCFHCKNSFPLDVMISGEFIRPVIADVIKKRDLNWTSSCLVCPECLNLFRSEYVVDALEDDKGELSRLELEVVDSLKAQETLTENLNPAFEKDRTFGERFADQIAGFGGSWTFIIIFFAALLIWVGINSRLILAQPFDPFPYILLNLFLSCLAALQAPIIMMSQSRLEARDRLRSENDYQVNLKAELEIRHLHDKLDVLLKHQWQKLLEIQSIQMDLMKEVVHQKAADNAG